MSIVLMLLTLIAALIVLLLIAAAMSREEYAIEREVTINKPVQTVFDYIKYLENQRYYNKWVMADPNAKRTHTGADSTAGYITTWDSDNKNVGKGEQEIKRIDNSKRIDTEVRFEKPFKGTSYSYMITAPVAGNQTNVKWMFTGKRNYMMKLMHLLLNLKKMLGRDIQESLGNLKTNLEK